MTAPAALVLDAFAALDDARIRWCLLRRPEPVPDPEPHPSAAQTSAQTSGQSSAPRATSGIAGGRGLPDLDLLVHPEDVAACQRALEDAGFRERPAWGRGSHRFFVGFDAAAGSWLNLDVVSSLDFGEHQEFRTTAAAAVVERAVRAAPSSRLGGNGLLPGDAFWALLLHCLLDRGGRPGRHSEELTRLAPAGIAAMPRDPSGRFDPWDGAAGEAGEVSPLAVGVHALLGEPGTSATVLSARAGDNLTWAAAALRGAWSRHDKAQVRQRALLAALVLSMTKLWVALRRRGVRVAIIGPDGAGKSSLAAGLAARYPFPVVVIYAGQHQSSADRPGGGRPWDSRRRQILARVPGANSLAVVGRQIAAGARSYWHTLRGRVVVFDRFAYDSLLPRAGEGIKSRLRRGLMGRVSVRPDVVLVLDAPGEVLHMRSGEHSPAALEAQRQGYLWLSRSRRNWIVVDTDRPAGQVHNDVVDHVWRCHSGRWSVDRAAGSAAVDAAGSANATGQAGSAPRVGPEAAPAPSVPALPRAVSSHTRQRRLLAGSSLLLVGRFLSLTINFITQLVVVRSLSSSDYGTFAFCLSVVLIAEVVVHLGLDRAVPRFIAQYDEEGRHGEFFGALLVQVVTLVCMATAVVLFTVPVASALGLGASATVVPVLAVAIALAPLQALDDAFAGIFAVLSEVQAIFVRKYLLAPLLRLSAASLVLWQGGGVRQLAIGYVAAAALGNLAYVALLLSTLRRTGLLQRFNRQDLKAPVGQLFRFSLPLLSSDLVLLLVNSVDSIAVLHWHGVEEVGRLRVVQPLALLNIVAVQAFTPLFSPHLARILARGERHLAREHYWQTAAWIATLSFPVVLLMVTIPGPLISTLYGERYAGSAAVLVIISLGLYLQAATGFNGLTLQVFGRVGAVVASALTAAAADAVLLVTLVPDHGAIGAAVASATALLIYNMVKQILLARGTGIVAPQRQIAVAYAILSTCIVTSGVISWLFRPGLILGVMLWAVVTTVGIFLVAPRIDVPGAFPAVRRIPVLGRIVSGRPASSRRHAVETPALESESVPSPRVPISVSSNSSSPLENQEP